MEHVTKGLYQAAAVGCFVLAISVMIVSAHALDGLFDRLMDTAPGMVASVEGDVDE